MTSESVGSDAASVRHAAVLGHPISHSLSPVLHRAAYAALGLPWVYDSLDVRTPELEACLDRMDARWAGVSLTMPLKEAVLPLLTTLSPGADLAQAANTIVFGDGARHGHNTDIGGIVAAVRQQAGVPIDVVTILGTGATARSAVVAAGNLGATRVHVVGRSANAIQRVERIADAVGVQFRAHPWADVAGALNADLVVSTVPADVGADVARFIPQRVGVLFDVLYDPWPPPLASAWSARGPVVGGLELLLHQAFDQVELMTGMTAPREEMRAAGVAALALRGWSGDA